jgi:tetratricopeptide (TPR) repeat protein
VRVAVFALAAAGALAGCREAAPPPQAAVTPPVAENPLVIQARDQLQRAESAPVPTPLPPPSPLPRGWKPMPPPELKPEEVEAIRLLEQAASAAPARREAHELLVRVLEPGALRQHERALAARGKKAPPPGPPDQGVDSSPARVARAYRAGVEAGAAELLEPMIAFASRVDDLDTMDWAHREVIRRARENDIIAPTLRYADFLRDRRRDLIAAAEQYRNALIWTPEDAATRAKVADIYLGLAKDHYARREYAGAEVRLGEAAKFVDPGSPHDAVLQDYRQRLADIRR